MGYGQEDHIADTNQIDDSPVSEWYNKAPRHPLAPASQAIATDLAQNFSTALSTVTTAVTDGIVVVTTTIQKHPIC